jgi:hypothetical protein
MFQMLREKLGSVTSRSFGGQETFSIRSSMKCSGLPSDYAMPARFKTSKGSVDCRGNSLIMPETHPTSSSHDRKWPLSLFKTLASCNSEFTDNPLTFRLPFNGLNGTTGGESL